MSSMGNSQDDAQQSSSLNHKPNIDKIRDRLENSNISPQDLNIRSEDVNISTKNSNNSSEGANKPNEYNEKPTSNNEVDSSSKHFSLTQDDISNIAKKLNQPFQSNLSYKNANGETVGQSSIEFNDIEQNKSHHTDRIHQTIDKSQHHSSEDLEHFLNKYQTDYAGISHPNFNASESPLDPDRPLTDIPLPKPRYQHALMQLVASDLSGNYKPTSYYDKASMWALVASPALASHLELLQLGGLIYLPNEFFEPVDNIVNPDNPVSSNPVSSNPVSSNTDSSNTDSSNNAVNSDNVTDNLIEDNYQLLKPLTEMTLLDMSDIYKVCQTYPQLTRYGFRAPKDDHLVSDSVENFPFPEILNDIFAPSWEPILYPERFDNGMDSLVTDILPCSVAVHILRQCQTVSNINHDLTIQQICQHMRSYVLSQCNINPQFEDHYRQIRLFEGHVIVAAAYLGFKISCANQTLNVTLVDNQATVNQVAVNQATINNDQSIYLNVSKDSALINRYPNFNNYYINGWS